MFMRTWPRKQTRHRGKKNSDDNNGGPHGNENSNNSSLMRFSIISWVIFETINTTCTSNLCVRRGAHANAPVVKELCVHLH